MAGDSRTSLRAMCGALCRTAVRLSAVLLFAWAMHLLITWVSGLDLFENQHLRVGLSIVFLVAYAVLISVPFVPGIEIGLSLIVMEGPRIAPLVYITTILGLSLAYAAGEWVPYDRLRRIFADLRLVRACRLLDTVEPLSRTERLETLRTRAPGWLRPLATRYRYVLIGALLNLPGNAIIGGGGGILFTAGLSRLFLPYQMIMTLLIAVAPVPLAVWTFGIDLRGLFDWPTP